MAKEGKKKAQNEADAAAAVSAGANPFKGGDDDKKSIKKKKKKKDKENGGSPVAAPEAAADDAAAEKKRKKKEKKASKKKKLAAEKAAAAEAAAAAAAPEETGATEKKKSKKDKKDKKKKKDKSQSGEASTKEAPSADGIHRGRYYREHPDITNMSASEVEAYQTELEVTVFGRDSDSIRPLKQFSQASLSIPEHVLRVTNKFDTPSAIQAMCWPPLLMGRDVIGIAKTGSGKTLGFMLPAYVHILDKLKTQPLLGSRNRERNGPFCLVLAPTRELAMQTAKVCDDMYDDTKIKTTCIYGGVDQSTQIEAINGGLHVIIATPGRLLGLLRKGRCSLKQVSYLVLDEADRMLDMGFVPDIRAIVGQINENNGESMKDSNRQTLLFSATWPPEIQQLGDEFVSTPVHVTIGSEDLTANHSVTQLIEVISDERPFVKDKRLKELLGTYYDRKLRNKMIIFVLYKKDVGRVERLLLNEGYQVTSLSSDRTQAERTKALEDFKSNTCPMLVATDVAARGLDIPNVSHVINYSFPLTVEDYVHRIGRTGRGGKTGVSHTFFTKADKGLSGELINVLREASANIPEALMAFGTGVKRKQHSMYGDFYRKTGATPMPASKKVKF